MAQISLSFSGNFWSMSLPLPYFQCKQASGHQMLLGAGNDLPVIVKTVFPAVQSLPGLEFQLFLELF